MEPSEQEALYLRPGFDVFDQSHPITGKPWEERLIVRPKAPKVQKVGLRGNTAIREEGGTLGYSIAPAFYSNFELLSQ